MATIVPTIVPTVVRSLGGVLVYSVLGFGAGLATNLANTWLGATVLPSAYGNTSAAKSTAKSAAKSAATSAAKSAAKLVAIVLKLLLVGAVLAGVELGFTRFAAAWQATTPGLFFVTLFFGVQTSLMQDVVSFAPVASFAAA